MSPRKTGSLALWLLALALFALLCYCLVIWSNCDSTIGSFARDFGNFHTSQC